jgi:hypothetical protein
MSNIKVNWQIANGSAPWITVHVNFLHVLLAGNYSKNKYGQQYDYTNHTGLTIIWMTDIQSYNPEWELFILRLMMMEKFHKIDYN